LFAFGDARRWIAGGGMESGARWGGDRGLCGGAGAYHSRRSHRQAAATATPTSETLALDFDFRPDALATLPFPQLFIISARPFLFPQAAPDGQPPAPLFSGLVQGYVGLYQINFVVPQPPLGVRACSGAVQSNLTVSVGGLNSFDGAGICVAPSE
jgi:hypothetical protein